MPDHKYQSFAELIESCHALPPLRTAVVYPCDEVSLSSAAAAAAAKIIQPTLVGPETQIRELAASLDIDLSTMDIFDAPDSRMAAEWAVGLAGTGGTDALMKGSLEAAELMSQVVAGDRGIRTSRLMSHIFIIHMPAYSKFLLLSDAAINITPSLEEKADIVQNAIDLAHALGISRPKVAILSTIEKVRSSIPSTIDAAALCKMADRGQIIGAILDGPLAFDDAVSRETAAIKHIQSPVAGDPDILIVPDLEAGTMLAKEVGLFASGEEASIVLGARVPIIVTSWADNTNARMASCACASLYAFSQNQTGNRRRVPASSPSLQTLSSTGRQP